MKFLGEGPTRLLPPPPSSSRGFDLEVADLWADPDVDGSTQRDDPVETIRREMLRHDHVFRSQLLDLHRLYWTQKSLMNATSYDQVANQKHYASASHSAADRMSIASFPGKAEDTLERSTISSQAFVLECDLARPPPPSPHALPHHNCLSASDFQLFHDCHSRAPETRCLQPPQPANRSPCAAHAAEPEPVHLTLATASRTCYNYADIDGRILWGGGFSTSKGPKHQVINLDGSSSDSEEMNRDAPARPPPPPPLPAPSWFRLPVCNTAPAGRNDHRLPKPFDMNHRCEEGVGNYGSLYSVTMQPAPHGRNNCKPEKTVLFDLNTVQYEDSYAVIQEATDPENNVSSSSAGSSSVVLHAVADANDGCATKSDLLHLGFGNTRSTERPVKVEIIDPFDNGFKRLESRRGKISLRCDDNTQSSRVVGSSTRKCDDPSKTNPAGVVVVGGDPKSKCFLELNSLPHDAISDEDEQGLVEKVVPSSNESTSMSQSKQCDSSSRYLFDLASDSRVTSSVTDGRLLLTSLEPSVGSTHLVAVERDVGLAGKRVEGGERSEEDTVSSRMKRICISFQDGPVSSSGEQKQGVQPEEEEEEEACAFIGNESQGDRSCRLSVNLLGTSTDDDALINDVDGRGSTTTQTQQQLNTAVSNGCGWSLVAQRSVAAESASPVNNQRNCCIGLHHRRDDDTTTHSKHRDLETDLMILTAAETLAHIFSDRGTSSRSPGSADAVGQETEEDMEECNAQPECSYDSLELIVLALPESQEDECSSPAFEPGTATWNGSSGLRFNTRRGRQLRDFQKDILPGIVSLSRHEICEDMHAFTEIVKFEELKRRGGRLGRGSSIRGGSRGAVVRKKRSKASGYIQRRL